MLAGDSCSSSLFLPPAAALERQLIGERKEIVVVLDDRMSVDPSVESTWGLPTLMTTTPSTTTTTTSTKSTMSTMTTATNNKSTRDYEASSSSSFPLRASTSAVPCTTTQSPSALSSTSLSVRAPSPSMLTERRKRERENDTTTQPSHFKLSKNTPLNQPAITNLAYEVLLKGIETMRDYAIFVLNPDGTVASWNKGAEVSLFFAF